MQIKGLGIKINSENYHCRKKKGEKKLEKLKKILKRNRMIRWLILILKKIKWYNVLIKLRKNKENRFILFFTPIHGNLGDQAILISELEFLAEFFPEKNIIEISEECFKIYSEKIMKLILADDTILIQGGGFLGTLWIWDEKQVRKILEELPQNRIIILPQTIFYENSEEGQKELKNAKSIYSQHQKLSLCCRDKKSYDFAIENCLVPEKNCFLFPDMVMHARPKIYERKKEREGILFCMRKDHEKVISNQQVEVLYKAIKEEEIRTEYTDTVVYKRISFKSRSKEVKRKLELFSKYRLVVTDRIHGMLFAAITGTPCIAFDNCSHKVSGAYEWIQYLDYVKIVNNAEEAVRAMKIILKETEGKELVYTREPLKKYRIELYKVITGEGENNE